MSPAGFMITLCAVFLKFFGKTAQKIWRRFVMAAKIYKSNDDFYTNDFYENQWRGSLKSAEIILPIVLEIVPNVKSAVDFGCGVGTWLSVLKRLGVNEIRGYDGSWGKKELLKIPQEYFTEIELDKEILVDKKYDMAISVEVAEHLPEQSAEKFIKTLTQASDLVVFSAAIPFQGGTNHINEQWQSYWYNIFKQFGFIGIDCLRKKIWNQSEVQSWYKQNIMLYINKKNIGEINLSQEYYQDNLDIVHPELYMNRIKAIKALENNLKNNNVNTISMRKLCKVAVKRILKKMLGEKIWKWLRELTKPKNAA
jgi:SAM-dependent methyltransferase